MDDESTAGPWRLDDQRAYLTGLSAGLVADVRATIDPEFAVDWFVDPEGGWSYRCFGSDGWYADAGDVLPPESELERQHEIERFVVNIVDNAWPDEWTDPWPRCPTHGDHPMNPVLWHDRVMWVCPHDRRVRVPVGELGSIS